MVTIEKSAARAFGSPFRYIQGPGVLDDLDLFVREYGDSIFLLIDGFLYDDIVSSLPGIFGGSSVSVTTERFRGECSDAEVDRVTVLAEKSGAAIIAGVGGGKTLDTAKCAANALGTVRFIIPTSASTDAPTSSMSVIYKDSGEHLRCDRHKRGPDLVLVDSRIIAKAPIRLFVAGMGDALSTIYEARANSRSDTANYIGAGYRRCMAGMAIAEMCHRVLMEDGLAAKSTLVRGELNEAVENVIEANILLSGLGFENTGCAAAHAIHTGFSELPETHGFYHGEVVAFGVVFQLALENAPEEELNEVLGFCLSVGLPVTLSQLNVAPTPENVRIIADRVMDGNSGVEAEPFPVTRGMIYDAILRADDYGRSYIERQS